MRNRPHHPNGYPEFEEQPLNQIQSISITLIKIELLTMIALFVKLLYWPSCQIPFYLLLNLLAIAITYVVLVYGGLKQKI